ncbi:pullulanase-type alpha-1,6-glucosidase [Chitinimonas sp. BJYL2]|uniref:pullulanase-type alpha-1,6-glucosidase n=1 Tax=Chitinimonas sp. BJYL2 TaxID=2976696 RepID=UPI0022B5C7BF|nr:pullulanase-type alpha-1,6-glucosidase [Chitinimonas sp. BJYL2]
MPPSLVKPVFTLLPALLACPIFAHAAGVTRADCDQAEHQTMLAAHPHSTTEARAYWLTDQQMQWPGMGEAHQFVLAHAPAGGIKAIKGESASGYAALIPLQLDQTALHQATAERFKFVGGGVRLALPKLNRAALIALHRGELVLLALDAQKRVIQATAIQHPGALDALFGEAAQTHELGAAPAPDVTRFKLWAPTAQQVAVCRYDSGHGKARQIIAMKFDTRTGIWQGQAKGDLSGQYYRYVVDTFVPGVGLVRNRVTDPYSVSLTTDSKRSYIARLDDARLKPAGWDETPRPNTVKRATDMSVYELHVRDFSIGDVSVSSANRGKYLAFTETGSNGMRHLQALQRAGMTDVHLLPVFDLASVPEKDCATPTVPKASADSEAQQAAVMAVAAKDCFNWGYDPFHFNAPEGSFASDAADGAKRILEFRQMVQALHRAGLRVGMDVVYNHMSAAGQHPQSVLDRIVPGYYHRLNERGAVERSTCCDNTATEHTMMAKLMIDSAELWAREYKIDSFRFDLMGHQPRAAMERLQARVDKAAGQPVQLLGEGWNFGEVANGARFVQASQLSLNGTGIGTFSDRSRDAVRGGGPADGGQELIARQGYINGLVYAPNALAGKQPLEVLMKAADMVRVGLAGTLRDYVMQTFDGSARKLEQIDYAGQPAGYASQPAEAVNYVENHDNQTLFDANVYKLPLDTSREDRARVQLLGAATTALSQGVAYFHAGLEILRSKSMDRNSYDSGDWFNRLDWTYTDNGFAAGLPPKQDNASQYALIAPLLANPAIKPTPGDIAFTRDAFNDLLRIRASTPLFRLPTTADIQQRLRFYNTGPTQDPTVIVGRLDGTGMPDAGFKAVLYFINVAPEAKTLTLADEQNQPWVLHPVQRAASAADLRPQQAARYTAASGQFSIPARSTAVYVIH